MKKKVGVDAALTRMMPGDADGTPENPIGWALAERIGRAVIDRSRPPFHVIITLPVHPEGRLNDGAVMTQIHWTMQSLVFGSQSLLNRVRRYFKARELYDAKAMSWSEIEKKVLDDPSDRQYESVPVEKCFEYLTLLNLRNWAKIGNQYVTEQIYVHSKLMIVDDLYAMIGSANINDRSLLGTRDSELAVLILDTDVKSHDTLGNGKPQPVRTFAHNLRKALWSKIFASEGLKEAIDKPGARESWKAIQRVAKKNTELYEAAFGFIPRNKPLFKESDPESASIWPTWHSEGKQGPMPFEAEFWQQPQHTAAAERLEKEIEGYITLLPIEWTGEEKNNLGYHSDLVTKNETRSAPTRVDNAIADNELIKEGKLG